MSGQTSLTVRPARTDVECAVLRLYAGLARGEHRRPAECRAVVVIGDISALLMERVWTESRALRQSITRKWGEAGAARIDALRIFAKPTALENALHCERVRRFTRPETLDGMPEFENGLFRLPKERGFFVPQYDDRGRTIELKFYEEKILR